MMPVLLTRPKEQSRVFAEELKDRFGMALDIIESPVLDIRFRQINADSGGYEGLVFTSQNGVAAAEHLGLPRSLPAICVGDRTAEAARALGFQVSSAQGDVTVLGKLIGDIAAQRRLLHLSGAHRAGALPDNVTSVIAYDQHAVPLNERARALLRGSKEVVIPLFSPRTAELFQSGLDPSWTSSLHGVCISENAARPLRRKQFETITICARPSAKAMIEAMAALLSPPSA